MARVDLALLSRSDLEKLLFSTTRALRETVDAVRENTKDEWKVRREVERIVSAYDVRVEPHIVRTAVDRLKAQRIAAADHFWEGVSDGPDSPSH